MIMGDMATPDDSRDLPPLTKRQREVLVFMVRGWRLTSSDGAGGLLNSDERVAGVSMITIRSLIMRGMIRRTETHGSPVVTTYELAEINTP